MGRFFRTFLERFPVCFQKGLKGLSLGVCYLIHSIGKFQVKSALTSAIAKIALFHLLPRLRPTFSQISASGIEKQKNEVLLVALRLVQ